MVAASAQNRKQSESVATAFIGVVTAVWLWPIVSFLIVTPLTSGPRERNWALGAGVIGLLIAVLAWRVPSCYFRLRPLEAGGRLYRLLGVRVFRLFVLNGDIMNRWLRPEATASMATIRLRAEQSQMNERMHLAALLISLPVMAAAWVIGRNGLAIYLALANIPFNVYPILLQRYTRGRLDRVLRHRNCPN